MPKRRSKNKKPPVKTTSSSSNENETVRIRHQRFDGFDIYTATLNGQRILFHKPDTKKLIIEDTFKFLGSFEKLWLCEDLESGKMHIAPFDRFTQLMENG